MEKLLSMYTTEQARFLASHGPTTENKANISAVDGSSDCLALLAHAMSAS